MSTTPSSPPSARPARPPLAVTAAVLWWVLGAFCFVLGFVLINAIGFERPVPALFTILGTLLFTIEGRMVWTGQRKDLAISGAGSIALAIVWWFIGSGQSRGFAYVPPALMIVAGLAALAARDAYGKWRSG